MSDLGKAPNGNEIGHRFSSNPSSVYSLPLGKSQDAFADLVVGFVGPRFISLASVALQYTGGQY